MKRLTDEQRQLAEQGIPKAIRAARRCPGNRTRQDDALSAAYWGLVQAAAAYRPDRGEYGYYAELRIRGQILDDLRRNRPRGFRRGNQREGAPQINTGGDELRALAWEPTEEELPLSERLLHLWSSGRGQRAGWNPRYRLWVYLIAVEGWTAEEVSAFWGLSKSAATTSLLKNVPGWKSRRGCGSNGIGS